MSVCLKIKVSWHNMPSYSDRLPRQICSSVFAVCYLICYLIHCTKLTVCIVNTGNLFWSRCEYFCYVLFVSYCRVCFTWHFYCFNFFIVWCEFVSICTACSFCWFVNMQLFMFKILFVLFREAGCFRSIKLEFYRQVWVYCDGKNSVGQLDSSYSLNF